MTEIGGILGISGGTLLILLIIILNLDKIYLAISFLLKPLSVFKFLNKKRLSFQLQGKLNELFKKLAPNYFDKMLIVKWLTEKNIKDKSYSLTGDDEITVYVQNKKNKNQIIIDVIVDFISLSLYPSLRFSIDADFTKSNELFISNRIIDEYKNTALTHLYKHNHFNKSLNDNVQEYLSQIQSMNNKNYYYDVFLDALKQLDEQNISSVYDRELSDEILNFFEFLLNVSLKEKDEKVDLTFYGKYLKYSVILVAKGETLSRSGLESHIKRIKDCRNKSVKRLYVTGFGRKNVLNVKKISYIIRKLNGLNVIFEENFDYETKEGDIKPFRLVVVDNTDEYHSSNDEDDTKEVENLLDTFIPEVNNGNVEIVALSREKGYGTKILVRPNSENINAIACCVGTNGERKNILSEKLNREMIHFVKYTEDIKALIKDALFPFKGEDIKEILIKSKPRTAIVVVIQGKGGLAVGRMGYNVKLAEDLIDWHIDIKEENEPIIQLKGRQKYT